MENSITEVASAAASDVDAGDTLTYSLGGVDSGFFSIDALGAITFTAPDFDVAQDNNGDNSYEIQVIVTDALGAQDTQNISVSLTNTNEAPVLNPIGNPSVLENSTGVITTATAIDPDALDTLTYTLGGVDAGNFSIDNATGAITFTAPDYENPLDNGGDNVYDIQIVVTDALGLQDTQNIIVTVIDVNEAPSSSDQQFSVSGDSVNGSIVGLVTGSDLDAGDTLSYTITDGSGVGSFAIDSDTGLITVANSNALKSTIAQVYTLSILVTDSSGNTSVSTITVSVSPSSISNPVVVSPPPSGQTNPSPERNDFIPEPTGASGSGYIFSSHLTLTSNDPGGKDTISEKNAGNTGSHDIKVDWLSSPKNVFGSEYLSYRSGGAFNDALDKMIHDIDESAESNANSIFSAGIRGTSVILTAGFAS
ncbi:MAG: cadherin repeat domain-containing protein, partial [Gammaproteobacteria bacterium]|nr:cadherin repeat domain-containing protein [Gammaproteobacteria bacterium]